MTKYTFICDYNGGTYISQVKADFLKEAILLWAKQLEWPKLSILKRKQLDKQIDDDPIPLDGIENVWCVTFRIEGKLMLINIVETV